MHLQFENSSSLGQVLFLLACQQPNRRNFCPVAFLIWAAVPSHDMCSLALQLLTQQQHEPALHAGSAAQRAQHDLLLMRLQSGKFNL